MSIKIIKNGFFTVLLAILKALRNHVLPEMLYFFIFSYYNKYIWILILYIISVIREPSYIILGREIIMMPRKFCAVIISIFILCLTACAPNDQTVSAIQQIDTVEVADEIVATGTPVNNHSVRNNTPVCLVPVASGKVLFSNSLAEIDASNSNEGYVMVKYNGKNPKVKLQITGSDSVTYTYNLQNGGYETFPLSAGSGNYKIAVYENVTGNQYSTALSKDIPVQITNVFGANLYPNQYVDFSSNSKVVDKAMILSDHCASDIEVVTKIYNFVTSSITYDHNKAATVQSGYTSDVDSILFSGTGICLDYAAVMTSMLRSQNIPTRLEVGYAGSAYHAWISTYITDVGWINGIIRFDGQSWSLMDPTFAANTSEAALKSFIGNGSNYQTKYVY